MNHIFGEQIEIGLDYLKILLIHPTQILNFLKAIFSENMTLNSNQDFRSNFNAEWVHKLIIGVDETSLKRKEDAERLKSLSTSKYYKIESKGFDRHEVEFFGKLILCSNQEDNFIFMEPNEIRYWIRKLPTLQRANTNLHRWQRYQCLSTTF
ncbi:MAG: primase-helicase family protein [Chitinophagaceae bacterium]